MKKNDEISNTLYAWAPELTDNFNSLAYLGSETSIKWLTESDRATQLEYLINKSGYDIAVEIWRKVLKERIQLPTPALLLIVEHMRRHPAGAGASLKKIDLDYSKTLANAAFRAADSLHDSAKESFAGDEIDIAIARFRTAISEFRFSIESKSITDETRKIATGKYATAVAMIGRWIDISPEVTSRALQYSQESMNLGNKKPETLIYRLELLILKFDQTNDASLLRSALSLLSENEKLGEGSELAEAEARFRLALIAKPGERDARRYLNGAESKLNQFRPRSGVEEARRSVLHTLITETKYGRLTPPATLTAIPRGLLALMATQPSLALWTTIRLIIDRLEEQRQGRGWVPAAVLSTRFLRQIVDGPIQLLNSKDISLYVEITSWLSEKASWNRHIQWEAGAAALSAAKRMGSPDLAHQAKLIFDTLAANHTIWPLPRIGIARVEDYLYRDIEGPPNAESWRSAAILALKSVTYTRSNLGGRNEVFAVADARGFLSETFVFKRTTKSKAEYEASMLNLLQTEITRLGEANRFGVPRSLAIVEIPSEGERRWVHVSQRAAGRLVSELRADEVTKVLDPIVELLSIFHRVAGHAPEGKSAWGSLKNYLKMWARTLFEPTHADNFVDSLRNLFPAKLPLVRKRDGHASNWLVDPAGRIVAIDLESSDFVPIGYDVAQLIEDNALVQANSEGWQKRLAVFGRYLKHLDNTLNNNDLAAAYAWFALTRALRLGTEREAGKQLRRHARELCSMLIECGDNTIKPIAKDLLQALSRIEQSNTTSSSPSHDHRRLSKSMAYQLRHAGPENGISIDKTGFAAMDALARVLHVDSCELLAVAEHPGEPRFEVRDGHIRALYGHSLDVVIDSGVNVGAPTSLYHGSSWPTLGAIAQNGLIPMQRRAVHLTNNAEEALAVGERKGPPLVLAITQDHNAEPVAEGIWVVSSVLPDHLFIVNPFIDEAGAIR